MRKILALSAAALLCGGVAQAQLTANFVKTIDISSDVSAATGVHAAHIAAFVDGSDEVTLYVTTLNNGAAGQDIPALKIEDALGTDAISVLDLNDGDRGGVAATRGYGGVGVDSAGNVVVNWSGNGNDNSARLRRYDASGTLAGEWVFTAGGGLNDRLGGLDLSADGTRAIGARFFNTTTAKVGFYELVGPPLNRVVPTTADPGSGFNPRDVAYDSASGIIYINSNGVLEKIEGGTIATPNDYAPGNGGTAAIVNTDANNNSFAGHGVGVNADGTLIAFSPSQNAGFGANTLRIVDPAGNVVLTLGTLDSAAPDATSETLFRRPIDAAFFSVAGSDYVAVTDVSPSVGGVSDYSRVVIYELEEVASPVSTVTVDGLGGGDFLTIQEAISSFTSTGANAAATPPFTINIDPAGGPYNERITLNDAHIGDGDIVGDLTIQSLVPGVRPVLALQRNLNEPPGVSTSALQIYQNEHNVTLRDLLIHPALPDVGTEDATRYIIKIDENSANAVFNTITIENCIITEVAADGDPLITSAAQAFAPPRADSASGRTSTFSNTVQTWGDAGESINVVIDGCVLYGPPPPGVGASANHLRAVLAGQDGESLTITDTIMAYGPGGHGIRFGANGQFTGTLTIDGLTVYNSPPVGANHLIMLEGATPASGPIDATITNTVLVRDVEIDTATRGISGGERVSINELSNSIIVTSGPGIVDVFAGPATWNNITIHNNSTAGNNATFLVGGAGSLDITNAIFSGPGTKLSGTAPTGGMNVDFSAFVEEGTDAIDARDDGSIAVVYGADIINDDPLYLSTTFGDADFLHVDSQCYEGAGTAGSDLAGGATYVGGEPCAVSVDEWMLLHN